MAAMADMSADNAADNDGDARTPVTVLSGALGAGKTTLLKYILEKPHGYRVAVIQNEFSEEMGIESPLIKNESGDVYKDIYELPNGCLCCSAKDGLISMLDGLLEVKPRRFDYVLVEAAGLADPEGLCEIFWVDDGLGCQVYLDGIVTLVDACNAPPAVGGRRHVPSYDTPASSSTPASTDFESLGLDNECVKQIVCADVLILNKIDLASRADLDRLVTCLATSNPVARVLQSDHAVVPLDAILGIRAFDRHRLAAAVADLQVIDDPEHMMCGFCGDDMEHFGCVSGCRSCDPGEGAIVEAHGGIQSIFLRGSPGALYDANLVRSWLASVLWDGSAGGVYRCKGLFEGPADEDHDMECSDDEDEPRKSTAYAVQGVGKLFEIEDAPQARVEHSKFLFVGRNLRRGELEDGFCGCLLGANR